MKEGKMLSKIPVDLEKIARGTLDKEILRAGIIAELDAINLYEQMAALTENKKHKKISSGYRKRGKDPRGRIPDPSIERR